MKKWYVAYVLSRHEKKTAERLTKMGIENFLPVQEEIRQWAHRRQKVTSGGYKKSLFMLDYSEEAVEMCSTPLAPGEMVRVIKGPLAGMEGELVNVDGRSKVVVRLEMLGYAGVDMPVGFVEAVK